MLHIAAGAEAFRSLTGVHGSVSYLANGALLRSVRAGEGRWSGRVVRRGRQRRLWRQDICGQDQLPALL